MDSRSPASAEDKLRGNDGRPLTLEKKGAAHGSYSDSRLRTQGQTGNR
jgi:hypothetical protein